MKKRIKEIIVVEGKNDTNTLQQFFECDTIETGGDQIVEATLERISLAQKTRGVIIFTDPDGPGEHIRRWINEHIPHCKNAFIDKGKAKTDKKVGVEHADQEALWEALSHCVTFDNETTTLTWADYLDLGLAGQAQKRYELCKKLHIGPCNGKTFFKRCNQMMITKEALLQLWEEPVNE